MAHTSEQTKRAIKSAIQEQEYIKNSQSPLLNILTYITIPTLAIIVGLCSSNNMLALLPLALLPTLVVYIFYQRLTRDSSRVKTSKLATTYIVTGTLGTLPVILYSTIASYLWGTVILGQEFESYLTEFYRTESDLQHADLNLIAKRAEMAAQPKYWVFLLIMSFDVIAFSEELLKYLCLIISLRYLFKTNQTTTHTPSSSSQDEVRTEIEATTSEDHLNTATESRSLLNVQSLEKVYVPTIVAGTLGFSTVENLGFIYGAINESEPASRLLQTILERLILSAPAHLFSAVYIAITVFILDHRNGTSPLNTTISSSHSTDTGTTTQSDPTATTTTSQRARAIAGIIRLLRILAVPIIFHGSFDFLLLAVSAYRGNIGWIHPRSGPALWIAIMGVLGLSASLASLVRRRWIRYGIKI